MEKIWNNIKQFCSNLSTHNVSEYTAQCAYYTILSFIPFIMLIATLVQYSGISKENITSTIQSLMPTTMSETTIDIIQEVYSKSVGTISISAIFVLWSAKKGFYALSKGLQNIYETKQKNNFIKLQVRSLILTAFLVLIIVAVLFTSVFGKIIISYLTEKFNLSHNVTSIFNISKFGIYAVLFIVLLLIYKFVPGGGKQKVLKQCPGAAVATLGWYIISDIFSIYLDTFKGFSVMYGSLTTIVLAMMWVYFCMYIILIGAEINNYKIK